MNNHPRRPGYALLMSLFLPGFGQLYNGESNKAIWLFLIFALLTVPGVALVALHLPGALMAPALAVGLLVTLAVWFYGMWDGWRGARDRQQYTPAGWQMSGVYVLAFVLANIMLFQLSGYVRTHEVRPFRVPSVSMAPTIDPGDFITADMRYNCPGCRASVQRGDVAIFVYPNNRTLYYVKRIIGLPGDHIRIRGESVWVNGTLLGVARQPEAGATRVTEREGNHEWQVRWTHPVAGETDITVPPGRVFVLGDNRNSTVDSRRFGTVALRDVVGKVRQIWFSWGPHGVRWQRIGKTLQ